MADSDSSTAVLPPERPGEGPIIRLGGQLFRCRPEIPGERFREALQLDEALQRMRPKQRHRRGRDLYFETVRDAVLDLARLDALLTAHPELDAVLANQIVPALINAYVEISPGAAEWNEEVKRRGLSG